MSQSAREAGGGERGINKLQGSSTTSGTTSARTIKSGDVNSEESITYGYDIRLGDRLGRLQETI
jgi:hypothetical protein